ncbi:MAG TPA: hypothetical protein VFL29_00335 [Candidatus Dormibacteraeota bacterium]|nr:hypothetical protein [Candidatus Dormibacteraeota bacterium]
MSLRAVACRLGPVFLVVLAVLAAAAFATLSPGSRRAALADACPASGPPCPANAYISLSVTAGGPSTSILVSGGSFLAGESMSLYWDSPSKVIGSATANGSGSFSNVKVKPFAGEKAGTHAICASVTPQPCATFLLQGSPTPTPSSAASPSESPSPVESPSPSASPSVIPIPAASTNGIDLILKPPLVFLPLAGLAGVVLAVAWWLFSVFPRQQRALPAASVVHRSTRPTWGGERAAATPEGPAAHEVEADRPPWPDFPEGTDERPHWAPPQPPQPDEPEDMERPEG